MFWLVATFVAWAQTIHVKAWVGEDLQTITGEMVLSGGGVRLVDPMADVPTPENDRDYRRTFPGSEEQGWVHFERVNEQRVVFHTILPRRYGATGTVPGMGLFANGGWLPQPVAGGELAPVDWVVELNIPEGAIGVLNHAVGSRSVQWRGRGERLSLAVVPKGHTTPLNLAAGRALVVSRHPLSGKRTEQLTTIITEAWPGPDAPNLTVVVAPLRRRLVRPGFGVLYISDRALRLTGPLWRLHVLALHRGVMGAGLTRLEDPFLRGFVAAALADDSPPPMDARGLVGWASWVPQIDALLYSGTMPFFSDVFDETYPGDPIRDDLDEVFTQSEPPRAVSRRVDAQFGDGTAARVAEAVLEGRSFPAALNWAGVPPIVVESWRKPLEPIDIEVRGVRSDTAGVVRLHREAAIDVVSTPVVVDIDGTQTVWMAGPGPDDEVLSLEHPPDKVVVNPNRVVPETRWDNNRWPRRWTAVVAAMPTEFQLSGRRLSAFADVALRRQYGSRWIYAVSLETSPRDTVAGNIRVLRTLGPLQDRRSRPYLVVLGVESALLDADFRPTAEDTAVLGMFAGLNLDTRVEDEVPREGHRLSLVGTAGTAPGGTQRWTSLGLRGGKLFPLAGRTSLLVRANTAIAGGDVAHRLLSLGGTGNVQGIRNNLVIGRVRGLGGVELRQMLLRQASIPLPLVWLSDLQVSGALEAGMMDPGPDAVAAVGWSAGLFFLGDVLGAQPEGLGVTLAGPLWFQEPDAGLEGYLRFDQGF